MSCGFDDVAREELAMFDERAARARHELEAKQDADRDRLLKRLERDVQLRVEKQRRFEDGEYWTPADGVPLRISDMTPGHAGRARDMLARKAMDWAHGALGVFLPPGPAEEWVRATPVFRALDARAKERASWHDRRLDKRAYKKYEKDHGRRCV